MPDGGGRLARCRLARVLPAGPRVAGWPACCRLARVLLADLIYSAGVTSPAIALLAPALPEFAHDQSRQKGEEGEKRDHRAERAPGERAAS